MVWREDILDEMRRLQKRLDNIFSQIAQFTPKIFDEEVGGYKKAFSNFKETDKEYVAEIELPGVEKKDIKINVVGRKIRVKAERKKEKEKKSKEKYEYVGGYVGFREEFEAPSDAEPEKIKANYKNGILTLRIPKRVGKGREIRIE